MSSKEPTTATSGTHDVFISYARADQPFVRRLTEALVGEGRRAWVDWADIPPTAEWMVEIRAAIDAADTYLAVLSPDSVRSKVCAAELDQALQANKRIVPVLIRPVDESSVPDQVAKLNWVSFTDGFESGLARLVEALDTDLEHVRAHTHLLVRARDWEGKAEDNALLIRGRELVEAEAWLSGAGSREPHPTALQTRFLLASRRAATRRQRGAISGVTAMFLLAAVLGVVALDQRNEAVDQRRTARSRELAAAAIANVPTDPELALDTALQSARTERNAQTEDALRRAIVASNGRAIIRPLGDPFGPESRTREIATIEAVAFAPDGRLLTGGGDGVIARWDPTTGVLEETLADAHGWVVALNVTLDGRIIAGGSTGPGGPFFEGNGFVRVLDADGGVVDNRLLQGDDVHAVAVSHDGSLIVAGTEKGRVHLWDSANGRLRHHRELPRQPGRSQEQPVFALALAPDGRWLAVGAASGAVRVYDSRSGRLIVELVGHQGAVTDATFTPYGRLLTAGTDRVVRIWEARSWRSVGLLPHPVRLRALAVSPGGEFLATADNAGDGRIWDLSNQSLITELLGHDRWITDVAFSPDSGIVGTASADNTARVWSVGATAAVADFTVPAGIAGHGSGPLTADHLVSGGFIDDRRMVIADASGRVAVRDSSSGRILLILPRILPDDGRLPSLIWAAVSPDGTKILTVHDHGQAYLWGSDGAFIRALRAGATNLTGGIFSADGSTVLLEGYRLGDRGFIFDIKPEAIPYDVLTGDLLSRQVGVYGDALGVAIAPDASMGALLANRKVALWNPRTGDDYGSIETGQDSLESSGAVGFTQDGKELVTPGPRGTILFWPMSALRTGLNRRPTASLQTHHEAVTSISLSGNGRYLATAGSDGAVRVWTLRPNHELVMEFQAGSSDARLVAEKFVEPDLLPGVRVSFSPDGRHIVALMQSGVVRIYACDLCVGFDQLVSLAESLLATA